MYSVFTLLSRLDSACGLMFCCYNVVMLKKYLVDSRSRNTPSVSIDRTTTMVIDVPIAVHVCKNFTLWLLYHLTVR